MLLLALVSLEQMSKFLAQPRGNFICLYVLLQNYTGFLLISIVFGPEFPHQQNTGHAVSAGVGSIQRDLVLVSLSLLRKC